MYMHTNYDDLPLVLSVNELAKILQIGQNTAYEIVRSGRIKAIRLGRQYRIPKESLRDFFELDRVQSQVL